MSAPRRNIGGYDDGYQSCACFWGTAPGSLVLSLVSRLPRTEGLRVLDAGCGEGKNAIFLAARGAEVRAFDVSDAAIANARRLHSHAGVSYAVGDVRRLNFDAAGFDVVIAYGLLHCLNDVNEVVGAIAKLQRATAAGGFHVLCAFNDRFQDLSAHPGFAPVLLRHSEYLRLYADADWEVVQESDEDLVETHPHNGIQHTHSMTRIVARKNNAP